jgi:hypothetical protein
MKMVSKCACDLTVVRQMNTISNVNRVRIVNIAISKISRVRSIIFPHCNILKSNWTSPDWKALNQIANYLIARHRYSSLLDIRSFRAADCNTDHSLLVAEN